MGTQRKKEGRVLPAFKVPAAPQGDVALPVPAAFEAWPFYVTAESNVCAGRVVQHVVSANGDHRWRVGPKYFQLVGFCS